MVSRGEVAGVVLAGLQRAVALHRDGAEHDDVRACGRHGRRDRRRAVQVDDRRRAAEPVGRVVVVAGREQHRERPGARRGLQGRGRGDPQRQAAGSERQSRGQAEGTRYDLEPQPEADLPEPERLPDIADRRLAGLLHVLEMQRRDTQPVDEVGSLRLGHREPPLVSAPPGARRRLTARRQEAGSARRPPAACTGRARRRPRRGAAQPTRPPPRSGSPGRPAASAPWCRCWWG